jgi:hypothetical protein
MRATAHSPDIRLRTGEDSRPDGPVPHMPGARWTGIRTDERSGHMSKVVKQKQQAAQQRAVAATVRDPYKKDRDKHSRAALAKLAHSALAVELADVVAHQVPVHEFPNPHQRGLSIIDAKVVIDMAEALLDAAVVYEHEMSHRWEDIGHSLGGLSASDAKEQCGHAWEAWSAALDVRSYLAADPVERCEMPDAVYDPAGTGRRLDAWVHQRGFHPEDPHPVTGRLPSLKTVDESRRVMEEISYIVDYEHSCPLQLAGLYEESGGRRDFALRLPQNRT